MTNLTDACLGCPGRCCTRRFWGRVCLTDSEARDPLFKPHLTMGGAGFALAMGKHTCPFLKRGRCSIYKDRPVACRGYVCHTAGGYSTATIHRFPALKRHLARHKLLPEALPPKSYFWQENEGHFDPDERYWHLKDIPAIPLGDVWRWEAQRYQSRRVGWFDKELKFHRRYP